MVDVPVDEVAVRLAGGEVQQVIDDEDRQDRAAPAHGPRRVSRLDVLLAPAIADRASLPAPQRRGRRRPDVKHDRGEQRAARDPDEPAVQQLPQQLAVVVERLRPEVHLQVPDHVADDEQDQHDPGHRHDDLLPHRRCEEGGDPALRFGYGRIECGTCHPSILFVAGKSGSVDGCATRCSIATGGGAGNWIRGSDRRSRSKPRANKGLTPAPPSVGSCGAAGPHASRRVPKGAAKDTKAPSHAEAGSSVPRPSRFCGAILWSASDCTY